MLRNVRRCRQWANIVSRHVHHKQVTSQISLREHLRVSARCSSSVSDLCPKLVIFDKDGTLTDYHYTWAPWTEAFTESVVSQSGKVSSDSIYEMLGYNPKTRKFVMGSHNGTREELAEDVSELLSKFGHSEEDAEVIFESSFADCNQSSADSVQAIDEPLELVQKLKYYGIKVAVCTSDTRVNTLQVLETIGIADHVDMVVCADDEGTKAKPHPHNAAWICKNLGVSPSEAVMVGDSMADIGMGQSAQLRTSIAVLSGLSKKSELEDADHIVPSIRHILPIIFPSGQSESGDAVSRAAN